ncbi:MAG: putative cyclase [Acidimicrobiia bacterium]|nr:putative cyclase [Acidimicrobiia bacterium]
MGTTSEHTGNWGRWGADDERGALNLLTPDVVLKATQVCRTGTVYSLGLPVQSTGVPLVPFRGTPMRLTLMNNTDDKFFEENFGAKHVGANEDLLVLASHNETHMDALCHVHHHDQFYNGFPADSMHTHSGASRCGIDKTPWLVGRAVLFDLCAQAGVEVLPDGHVITVAELEACAAAQGSTVRPGDIVLLHTGWLGTYMANPGAEIGAQPGIGIEAARLLAGWDVAAVGADNSAVEVIPFDDNDFLCVHVELLVRHGIPLLEHLVLTHMAADRVYESLLVVAPLPVTGGTGSPINPIAIA